MKCAYVAGILLTLLVAGAPAEVCNLKVVTDASPDYTDLASMVHSMTAKWPTTQEKCWAAWYWMHIARRQTAPMKLHGQDLTDPIRQANDYGYMMCSTVAGVNCGVWNAMGLKVKYWDISLHTVPECFYDGRWHMYDSSMSALYTLCDGKEYTSVGLLDTDWRWKDLPANHIWPDHERIEGATFRVVPPRPVEARYVQYKVTSRRMLCATELEVLDAIRTEPFDLRVALPDEKP